MLEIASAAYWAADARNGDQRLAKSTEPSVNPLRAAIESIYSQLIAKASPAPIAAEADAAKHETCQKCGRMRPAIHNCFDDPLREPPDRLAPIEARGVEDLYKIAGAAVCEARNHWSGLYEERWLEFDEGEHPDDFIGRAVVDALLRARESAPAVEK